MIHVRLSVVEPLRLALLVHASIADHERLPFFPDLLGLEFGQSIAYTIKIQVSVKLW
jgi:hypothetical protein